MKPTDRPVKTILARHRTALTVAGAVVALIAGGVLHLAGILPPG